MMNNSIILIKIMAPINDAILSSEASSIKHKRDTIPNLIVYIKHDLLYMRKRLE